MRFLLADSFTGALARLPAAEAKSVKTTVVDLQIDPTGKGLSFHRIDKSKDPNFWSVRVGRDLRLIVHKTADSLLVAYVDHHDKAYGWAERRRIEAHPTTGAVQIVEVRERVEEVTAGAPSVGPAVAAAAPSEAAVGLPFAGLDDQRCSRSGFRPTGSAICVRRPRTPSSTWPRTFRPRRRKRYCITQPTAYCQYRRRPRLPMPMLIQTHSAASG